MRLNLREIIPTPGAVLPFAFEEDLSSLEWNGERPFVRPVRVAGRVRTMAGALALEGQAEGTLSLRCDRCLTPFSQEKSIKLDTLLASHLEDEESEGEITLLDGETVDLSEIVRSAAILSMDAKHLCSPDCKGLCPRCGANLNDGPCGCAKEVDPRLAVLGKLLEGPQE